METNENFFIGKQWEGVQANGLPTPVFNFLKRTTLFTVASITSDNLKLNATPLKAAGTGSDLEDIADTVNNEFAYLFEHNNITGLLREFMRNAAVDGDGCTFTYWDADSESIKTEIIENTRVLFGNPNDRRVQSQPYILISSREMLDAVRERAECDDPAQIQPDEALHGNSATRTDDKVTVILKLWRDKDSGSIHGYECTQTCTVRKDWNLGITHYPITWLNWDYVQDCYHGMAQITGLIPNQIFVNKAWAMVMLSLMTTAYPKIIYDKTRVARWDNRVGAAIGVAGNVADVAKIIDPAQLSPQVSQLIELAVDMTQTLLGATSAALGDTRPDNTSAIIALQRASSVPAEITKQNLYQSIEDLGRIYIDFMGEYYGVRKVERPVSENLPPEVLAFVGTAPDAVTPLDFDFSVLKDYPMSLKLDVGASSYWSEIASMQTLDNLLMQGQIDIVDYLERLPDGYVMKKQELIEKIKSRIQGMPGNAQGMAQVADSGPVAGMPGDAELPQIPLTAGNSELQRKITQGENVG